MLLKERQVLSPSRYLKCPGYLAPFLHCRNSPLVFIIIILTCDSRFVYIGGTGSKTNNHPLAQLPTCQASTAAHSPPVPLLTYLHCSSLLKLASIHMHANEAPFESATKQTRKGATCLLGLSRASNPCLHISRIILGDTMMAYRDVCKRGSARLND
jgi:hypothetical protein